VVSRRLIAAFALTGCLLAAGPPVMARAPNDKTAHCDFNSILRDYAFGLGAYRKKDFGTALSRWRPLAARGFQPAARWIAVLFANGRGVARDLVEAAYWARIATHGLDIRAGKIAGVIDKRLSGEDKAEARRRFKKWKPDAADCWTRGSRAERVDDFGFNSRFGIGVSIDPRLKKPAADLVFARFDDLIDRARSSIPMGFLYLKAVERVEVHIGDRYDRFLRFEPRTKDHVLQMSIGNFLDKTPEYAAKAIAYEAYRHIYGRLGDSEFKDPYVATYKDKRLTGSIYPDVDNQEFFKVMKQVADLTSTLPKDLQIPYRVVDEIRYTPHSKYFEKSGVLDGGVAYYDRRWSHPGRRIIFLRRNLRFSSPVDTLLSVIHEGVHVVQDIRSESFEDRILEKRIRLENLEKAKKGKGPEAGTIRIELARMDDYVKRWRRGVLKEGRLVQDIRFECEATMTEIEVAKAVGAPPEMVERSQYLSLCDDARVAIARWKEGLFRKKGR